MVHDWRWMISEIALPVTTVISWHHYFVVHCIPYPLYLSCTEQLAITQGNTYRYWYWILFCIPHLGPWCTLTCPPLLVQYENQAWLASWGTRGLSKPNFSDIKGQVNYVQLSACFIGICEYMLTSSSSQIQIGDCVLNVLSMLANAGWSCTLHRPWLKVHECMSSHVQYEHCYSATLLLCYSVTPMDSVS